MKEIVKEQEDEMYFDCVCHSLDHTIHFQIYEDEEDIELYLQVQLINYRNIFKRIIVAIKYIFGYKCRYGHWDCWTLRNQDSSRLKSILERYINSNKNKI